MTRKVELALKILKLRKNPIAKALRVHRPKTVQPKKGKRAYSRKNLPKVALTEVSD